MNFQRINILEKLIYKIPHCLQIFIESDLIILFLEKRNTPVKMKLHEILINYLDLKHNSQVYQMYQFIQTGL
jgi:hypothetical protein